MELLRDPALLERGLDRHGLRRRMPWVDRYPWTLSRYRDGEYVCRYQEPIHQLVLLLEGRVGVSLTTAQGRTHLVTFCPPGTLICGDVEVALGNTLATADLWAQGDALCAAIPIAPHRAALLEDTEFLRCALQRLAGEMVKDSVYAANNLLLPLGARLAAYILEHAEGDRFRANLTRTAELLGVSYRQLSRVMRTFLQQGWLEREPGGWHILARAGLEEAAAPVLPLNTTETR